MPIVGDGEHGPRVILQFAVLGAAAPAHQPEDAAIIHLLHHHGPGIKGVRRGAGVEHAGGIVAHDLAQLFNALVLVQVFLGHV